MPDVLTIAGSPSNHSRSAVVLSHARSILEQNGLSTDAIRVRDLPAEALLSACLDDVSIQKAIDKVQVARAVVIGTPIYRAAYSGVLKAFLDVLPQGALADKVVLPIATAGTPAHFLALDYALRPVLVALGANFILDGLYLRDSQVLQADGRIVSFDATGEAHLIAALGDLTRQLARLSAYQVVN